MSSSLNDEKIDAILLNIKKNYREEKLCTIVKPVSAQTLRLHTNEVPIEFPAAVKDHFANSLKEMGHYPDETSLNLRVEMARYLNDQGAGISHQNILASNGSASILHLLYRLFLDPGDEVTELVPNFGYCAHLANLYHAKVHKIDFPLDLKLPCEEISHQAKASKFILFSNPNNPTGLQLPLEEIEKLLKATSQLVIVDEAYVDYSQENALSLLSKYSNLMILRTFSKSYGMAGARLGFAFGHEAIIEKMMIAQTPFSICRGTQALGLAVLENMPYFQKLHSEICQLRDWCRNQLQERGFHVLPSSTNFLFASPLNAKKGEAARWQHDFLARNICVGHFPQTKYPEFLRIGITNKQEMTFFIEQVDQIKKSRSESSSLLKGA